MRHNHINKNGIDYEICNELSYNLNDEFESLFITVKTIYKKILVGEVYRPPISNINLSIERFDDLITKCMNINKNVIIVMDHNYNLLQIRENNKIKEFLHNLFIKFSFTFLPTRCVNTSETFIDNFF